MQSTNNNTTSTKSSTVATNVQSSSQYASDMRPNQVVEVLYPSAQDRTTTTTTTAASRPVTAQQTTTTTTTAATTRKPLDLDMTASHVDSYSAPTPIHLTIHEDPEEAQATTAKTAASSSNAIAYLHSVHPALPVASATGSSSSSTLQQPQPTRERRNSEGAATSLNGLWTPMGTEQQHQVQTQRSPAPIHGDQVYATEAPVIPAHPLHGSMVTTNPHDNQYYDNRARVDRDAAAVAAVGTTAAAASTASRTAYTTQLPSTSQGERVMHVNDVSGSGRTTVLVGSAAAAGPLVVGETRQLGGVEQVRQVDEVSGMTGERLAVTSAAQRQMPASQTFASSTGPQIVQVDNASSMSGQRVAVAGLAAGPMVVGETRELGGGEQLQQVDDVSRLSHGERVAVASMAQRQVPSNQVFASTTGSQVVMTPGLTTNTSVQSSVLPPNSPAPVHGDQVYASEAPVIQAQPLHGSVVTTNAHDNQYYDNRARVDRDAALVAGAAVGAAAHHHVHSQQLDETAGPTVVQTSDTTNLLGGFRTPVVVESAARGPLVVGDTHELGSREEIREVDDLSRLGQAERVAIASTATQRQMPSSQVFTSTSGPQIVQVGNAASMTGQRLDVATLAAGPMVVGTTNQVGGGEQLQHVEDMSRLSQAERVAVASMAQRQMPSNQVFTSTAGPQIVHSANTSTYNASQSTAMGTPYTQQLGGVNSASTIQQVDDVSSLSSVERLDLAYRSATGAMHTTALPSTAQGESITHVTDSAHMQSGTPVVVGAMAARPMIVGTTQQVGGGEQLQHVEDMSRLSQAERLALASAPQRQMPSNQVFTSTTGSQIVQTGHTAAYDASQTRSVAMGTAFSQRLDDVNSAPSITQVGNTASMSGQRFDVAGLAAGPMVVGSTQQVGGGQQLQQVDDMSRLSHGERVAVASMAQRQLPSNQVFASTSGPQIVHTSNNYSTTSAQSSAMGTAYTQRLDEASSTPSITQVNSTSALSGERLALNNNAPVQSTTSALRTHELSGVSQPQAQYVNQTSTHTTVPASQAQAAVQHTTQTVQHTTAQVPVTSERTTITREAVSAEEAAAQMTVRPHHIRNPTITYADGTNASLDVNTEQPTYEHRTERVEGGPVQVLHVDAARLVGKEQLGSEAFSVAKENAAAMDSMSGGMKGMQLDDREQQNYRKEEL